MIRKKEVFNSKNKSAGRILNSIFTMLELDDC